MDIINYVREKKAEHMARRMTKTHDREEEIEKRKKKLKTKGIVDKEIAEIKLKEIKAKQELRELRYSEIKKAGRSTLKGLKAIQGWNEKRQVRMTKSTLINPRNPFDIGKVKEEKPKEKTIIIIKG